MLESSLLNDGIHITKYASRHWAVWINQELIAVTVYRRGATQVAELLRCLPEKLGALDAIGVQEK